MAGPIKVSFVGDTKALKADLGSAESSMLSAAATAEKAGNRIDSSFESTAGHADDVASKGSQAAGAFSGLGSLAAESGGKVGALGSAMVVTGVATQAAADAGDLLNVVTESTIAKNILNRTTTIATAIATRTAGVATKGYAVAQRILNAAMNANPLGLLITGLVLVAGALVLAYKKSATFRAIVNGAFGAVKAVIGGVLPTAEKVLGFIALMPLKIIQLEAKMALAGVRFIGGLFDGVLEGAKSAGGFASDLARTVLDSINNALNLPLTVPRINTHIPGVGTVGGQTLIPRLARGGIVIAGDNPSGIEAIVPLERAGDFGFGGRQVIVHLTVNAPVGASSYDIGEELAGHLREFLDGGGDL